MARFAGRVALVSGAASGIGLACAARLVAEGAEVVLTDRDAGGAAVAGDLGARAHFMPCDIALEADWRACADAIRTRFGRLHVLVCNAGITASGTDVDCENADTAHIAGIMAVNFAGTWAGMRACLGLMQGGAIVTVASRAALVGTPLAPAYAASKAALVSLTRSLALHCARNGSGIRCNAVLPGSVDTPMWRPISAGDADRAAVIAAGLPHIPLGRLATPAEIAAAVLFLATDDASYITGTTLLVDGGQSCL